MINVKAETTYQLLAFIKIIDSWCAKKHLPHRTDDFDKDVKAQNFFLGYNMLVIVASRAVFWKQRLM